MRLAFINGSIFTPERRDVTSVLIDGDEIARVGEFSVSMNEAKIFDLKGRYLAPGFIDSHTHFVDIGLNLARVDLSNTTSLEDALDKAEERLRGESKSTPLICVDFDESKWRGNRIPKKEELDRLSKDRGVIFRRVCGHIAVANTGALKEIPGGISKVDHANGILLEDAVLFINDIFPPATDEIREAIIRAQRLAHSLGVTSVHDMTLSRYLAVYREMDQSDILRLRVYAVLPIKEIDYLRKYDGNWLKTGGIKVFADGSIGARTAALKRPYPGTDNYGILNYTRRELQAIVRKAEDRGYQVLVHAIGDRSIEQVLDVYESELCGNRERNRIEHFELAEEESIKKAERLGILLAMQPNFITNWGMPGGMYERMFGLKGLYTNRFRTILDKGNRICFGSDSMPFGPLYGIEGAMKHPKESISFEEALRMYTIDSAYAGFYDEQIGSIEEGKKADLVVLSGEVPDLKVDMTMVNGEVVFQSDR